MSDHSEWNGLLRTVRKAIARMNVIEAKHHKGTRSRLNFIKADVVLDTFDMPPVEDDGFDFSEPYRRPNHERIGNEHNDGEL
jgi:hypothetical protein